MTAAEALEVARCSGLQLDRATMGRNGLEHATGYRYITTAGHPLSAAVYRVVPKTAYVRAAHWPKLFNTPEEAALHLAIYRAHIDAATETDVAAAAALRAAADAAAATVAGRDSHSTSVAAVLPPTVVNATAANVTAANVAAPPAASLATRLVAPPAAPPQHKRSKPRPQPAASSDDDDDALAHALALSAAEERRRLQSGRAWAAEPATAEPATDAEQPPLQTPRSRFAARRSADVAAAARFAEQLGPDTPVAFDEERMCAICFESLGSRAWGQPAANGTTERPRDSAAPHACCSKRVHADCLRDWVLHERAEGRDPSCPQCTSFLYGRLQRHWFLPRGGGEA